MINLNHSAEGSMHTQQAVFVLITAQDFTGWTVKFSINASREKSRWLSHLNSYTQQEVIWAKEQTE